MPYIRTWNSAYESTPDGSDLRSTVDDRIRELKVDIRERMESLVTAWSSGTDPVVLKPESGGPVTGKVLMLHAGSFGPSGGGDILGYIDENSDGSLQYALTSSTNIQLIASLLLPATAVITSISGLFYRVSSSNGAAVSVSLRSKNYGNNFTSNPNLLVSTRSYLVGEVGPTNVGGTGSITLQPDEIYWIQVQLSGSTATPRFYGVKIIYNVPDARALR